MIKQASFLLILQNACAIIPAYNYSVEEWKNEQSCPKSYYIRFDMYNDNRDDRVCGEGRQ